MTNKIDLSSVMRVFADTPIMPVLRADMPTPPTLRGMFPTVLGHTWDELLTYAERADGMIDAGREIAKDLEYELWRVIAAKDDWKTMAEARYNEAVGLRARVAELTIERDALREELAAEKALADRLYVQSGGAWDAYRKARGL